MIAALRTNSVGEQVGTDQGQHPRGIVVGLRRFQVVALRVAGELGCCVG